MALIFADGFDKYGGAKPVDTHSINPQSNRHTLANATAYVRLTKTDWEQINAALQYAAGDGLEVADRLRERFGKGFEASPQLIGQAADLIELFVAARFVTGPVHVAITGPQGSGKTVLTAAITHALRLVKVPVHIEGSDPFEPGVQPTYTIRDGEPPHPRFGSPIRRTLADAGVPGFTILPVPLSYRLRHRLRLALGRLKALSRGLGR